MKQCHAREVMVSVLLLTFAASAQAENWPRFRGPNGQGISDGKTIPVTWSQTDIRWKIDLPGGGHSSPVIWDEKVFVTSADDKAKKGILLCVNASDGRELWRKDHPLTPLPMNALNAYASATPALDAEHIYVVWPGADVVTLAALTHDGNEAWAVRLPGVQARHGAGSSPIVFNDLVIVSCERDEKSGSPAGSVWLAVDRRTGRIRWRYGHPKDANASYSTPCVYRERQGRDQLIFTSNSHGIAALRPDTGELLWKTEAALPNRVVSSPVIAGELVIATCGEGGGGIRLSAAMPPDPNSLSRATEVYSLDRGVVPYVPTPVLYEGLLFTFHDNGTVSCLRAATGEVLWSAKPAGRYYGSPVCVAGNLYCITLDGDVVVLKAGPTYERLAVNAMGEKSHATPAVADGRMLIRTFSRLYCIGAKAD